MRRNLLWSGFRIIALIFGLGLIGLTVGADPAQAGGTVGSGAGTCSEAALDAALAGGGTITFNCGGAATINITTAKQIKVDTTINGGGQITLKAVGNNRFFATDYRINLTLQGLTLRDANYTSTGSNDPGGAAVYINQGNLTVSSCSFINNSFTASGSGSGDDGGAIFIIGGTLTVDNTYFGSNHSYKAGGSAIHSLAANVTIRSSSFVGNSSTTPGNGGAFYSDNVLGDNGFVLVQNTGFIGNSSQDEGGAVRNNMYLKGQTGTFDHVSFISNTVSKGANISGHGGALRIGDGTFNINDSLFQGNHADGQGGGLWTGETVYLTVANTGFYYNDATDPTQVNNPDPTQHYGFGGGLAAASQGSINLANTTFSNNKSGFMGGGMSLGTSAPVRIANSTIADNEAYWQGGGIQNGNSNVTLVNSIIAYNVADNGVHPEWNVYHNCFPNNGKYTNGGHNLQYSALNNATSEACATGITQIDPLIAPLADNGGFSQTRAPRVSSPALNSGDASVCQASPVSGRDARGYSRPQSTGCEIGALEAVPPTLGQSVSPALIATGGQTTLSFTLVNPTAEPLGGISYNLNLPAGLQVAANPAISNNCSTPGTVQASGSAISLSGVGLSSNQTCVISLKITGSTPGNYTLPGSLLASTKTGPGATSNSVQLQIVGPVFTSAPGSLGSNLLFGVAAPGQSHDYKLTVRNSGLAITNLTINLGGGSAASAITSDTGGNFSLVAPTSFPVTLAGQTSQVLTLRCAPATVGRYTATLTLTSSDSSHPTVAYTLVCWGGYAVTNAQDDGVGGLAGSLSAVAAAQATTTTVGIYFDTSAMGGSTVHLAQSYTLPANIVLDGGCASGPGITIDGGGANGPGLRLSGNDKLFGLKITNFKGPVIAFSGGRNQFVCTVIQP